MLAREIAVARGKSGLWRRRGNRSPPAKPRNRPPRAGPRHPPARDSGLSAIATAIVWPGRSDFRCGGLARRAGARSSLIEGDLGTSIGICAVALAAAGPLAVSTAVDPRHRSRRRGVDRGEYWVGRAGCARRGAGHAARREASVIDESGTGGLSAWDSRRHDGGGRRKLSRHHYYARSMSRNGAKRGANTDTPKALHWQSGRGDQ